MLFNPRQQTSPFRRHARISHKALANDVSHAGEETRNTKLRDNTVFGDPMR